MWLLIAFIAIPLIEIALFIQIGGAIGLWSTLLVVVITAILGTYLVKQQGLRTLSQLQNNMSQMHDPTEPLVHGAMILFSGALLLTPGFFTDGIGFALLVPSIRSAVFNAVRSRIKMASFTQGPSQAHNRQPNTIDGDFQDITPEPRQTQGPSGWTKE